MATANAKIPAVFTCATDRERRTIEAAYDDTQSGKPILIIKKLSGLINKLSQRP